MVAARHARLEIRAILLRHNRYTANTGIARDQIVLGIKYPIAGFGELAGAHTHAVAHRAQHLAVTVELEELAVLARRHPGIALMVEVQGADQVAHLQGLYELAVGRIDNDAILFAVADPHIAILGIDGEAVGRVELALPHFIAEPLVDELAVLGEMDDAGHAFLCLL